MLNLIAALLVLAGFVLVIGGSIALLIAGFQESVLWGLGMLFIGVVTPVFMVLHWNRARGPFFIMLYGFAAIFAAVVIGNNDLPGPL